MTFLDNEMPCATVSALILMYIQGCVMREKRNRGDQDDIPKPLDLIYNAAAVKPHGPQEKHGLGFRVYQNGAATSQDQTFPSL